MVAAPSKHLAISVESQNVTCSRSDLFYSPFAVLFGELNQVHKVFQIFLVRFSLFIVFSSELN